MDEKICCPECGGGFMSERAAAHLLLERLNRGSRAETQVRCRHCETMVIVFLRNGLAEAKSVEENNA